MARATFRPGAGFPARFQRLLTERNLRLADLQRMTENQVNADTIGGWLKRKHLPEKHAFLLVATALNLKRAEVRDLLRTQNEPLLVRLDKHGRLLSRLAETLEEVESILPALSPEQRYRVKERVLATARAVRAVNGQTTTERGDNVDL